MEGNKLRSLHIASFDGNIGDHANHVGFWNLFRSQISDDVKVTNLEIREFYKSWGIRKFDNNFVKYVNNFDFIVFGGGNFFDIKWDYSDTSTTINLPQKFLSQIKVPIIFNGIGVDRSDSTTQEMILKFKKFITYCCSQDNIIVSVRNDGSKEIIDDIINDKSIEDRILEIPDGAFFTSCKSYNHVELNGMCKNIAINVVKDSVETRWPSPQFSYDNYCIEFGNYINKSLNEWEDIHYVFVPHIPSDIQAVYDILSCVKDYYCRKRITVAPYVSGTITNGDYIIDLYKSVYATIGMRYHSNICSIAMGTPTIGIVTLPKHKMLYEKINMNDRLFDVNLSPFADELLKKTENLFLNYNKFKHENMELIKQLKTHINDYIIEIKKMLKLNMEV